MGISYQLFFFFHSCLLSLRTVRKKEMDAVGTDECGMLILLCGSNRGVILPSEIGVALA